MNSVLSFLKPKRKNSASPPNSATGPNVTLTPIQRTESYLQPGSPRISPFARRGSSNPSTPRDLEEISPVIVKPTHETFINTSWKGGTKVSESLVVKKKKRFALHNRFLKKRITPTAGAYQPPKLDFRNLTKNTLTAPLGTELTKDMVAKIKQPEQILSIRNGSFMLTPRNNRTPGTPILGTPTKPRRNSPLAVPKGSLFKTGSSQRRKRTPSPVIEKIRVNNMLKQCTVQQVERHLYDACKINDIPMVELILSRHVNQDEEWIEESQIDIDAPSNDKRTALHVACQNNHCEIVSLLIEAGANVNVNDTNNKTPLHLAAASGSREALILLCGNGATVNVRDEHGTSPLHLAARNRHYQCIKDLLLFHADINFKRFDGATILHECMQTGDDQMIEFLLTSELRFEVLVNARDELGDTPLFRAVVHDQSSSVRTLLKYKQVGIQHRNNNGCNMFHLVQSAGMLQVLVELLNDEEPTTPNTPISPSRKALPFVSYESADVDIKYINTKLQRLLNEGDRHGQTPLHIAVKNNYHQLVKYMLSLLSRNDPKLLTEQTNSLSFLGSRKRSKQGYSCINVNAVDNKGNTPYHVAVLKNDQEMVHIFKQKSEVRNDIKNQRGDSVKNLLKKPVA
jgi:ankyrin repeat protein